MPFFLLFFGILFLVAAVRNKTDDLTDLLVEDFTGKGNFIYWIVSIVSIGAVGYVAKLKPFSDICLALIVLVLFLHNADPASGQGGFFAKFTEALNTTNKEQTT